MFDIAKSMPPSLSESWSGTIAFLQIYFDFSAYSDMAIGLGYCSGLYCLLILIHLIKQGHYKNFGGAGI